MFNDSFYKNSKKYSNKKDNFAYVRYHAEEQHGNHILKDLLVFSLTTDFCERTKLTLFDLLSLDPSTTTWMRKIYDEIRAPEKLKEEQLVKETEAIRRAQLDSILGQTRNKKTKHRK